MKQHVRRIMYGVFGMAGTVYLSGLAVLAARQRQFIFHPVKDREVAHPRSERHRARRIVLRADDGTRLEGWLLTPNVPGTCPLVIYFGGRSEEVSWIVRDAASLFPGIAVLAMNYRGYGGSHGEPTERSMMRDGLLLYRWACGLGFTDAGNIAVMGRSLGSGIALYVAAQCAVAAVVLLTPYDSVLAIARRRYPAWPVSLVLQHRFESDKYASHIAAPVLVIRAELDDIVPHSHTDKLVAQFKTRPMMETVPASNHGDIPYLPVTHACVARFLRAHLPLLNRPSVTH